MKWTKPSCAHCSSHPVKSVRSITLIQESGGFFTPTPDELHPEHFQTCLQMVLEWLFWRLSSPHQQMLTYCPVLMHAAMVLQTIHHHGWDICGMWHPLQGENVFAVITLTESRLQHWLICMLLFHGFVCMWLDFSIVQCLTKQSISWSQMCTRPTQETEIVAT